MSLPENIRLDLAVGREKIAANFDYLSDAVDALAESVGNGAAAFQFEATAGIALSGHRVVYIGNGNALYASSDGTGVTAIAGITTGAASAGAPATIQFGGGMSDPSWNWSPGPIWLELNGLLTQTAPASGAIVPIGTATGATRLRIELEAPIFLA